MQSVKVISLLSLVILGSFLVVVPAFSFASSHAGSSSVKQIAAEASQTPTTTGTPNTTGTTYGITNIGAGTSTINRIFGGTSDGLLFAQIISFIMTVIGAICFLIIDIVLIGRLVMLIALAVASPLPFILMVLPATKKYAQMWWQKFLKWAFVGVSITFFLWLIPATLGDKSSSGYFSSKSTTSLVLPPGALREVVDVGVNATEKGLGIPTGPKIVYPAFLDKGFLKGALTGEVTAADYVDGFFTFFFVAGFMIAAAWTAITLGETFGRIAVSIPRFLKNTAKGAGKLAFKGAKYGAAATGIPGVAKARISEIGKRLERGKKLREAGILGRREGEFSRQINEHLGELKKRGVSAEASRRIFDSGGLAGLEGTEQIAHILNMLDDPRFVPDNAQYNALRQAVIGAGGGATELANLENKVREKNLEAIYDLGFGPDSDVTPTQRAVRDQFKADFRRNPGRMSDLISKQGNISASALRIIEEVGGKKAVESVIKPHNEDNVMKTVADMIQYSHGNENYIVGDGIREIYAKKKGNLAFAFSRKSRTGGTHIMTTQVARLINTSPSADLRTMQFSPDLIKQTRNKITPSALTQLRIATRGDAARKYEEAIRADFDALLRSRKIIEKKRKKVATEKYGGNVGKVSEKDLEISKKDLEETLLESSAYQNNPLLIDYILGKFYKNLK